MVHRFSAQDLKTVFRDVGQILRMAAFSFVVPTAVSFLFGEPLAYPAIYLSAGILCWLFGRLLGTIPKGDSETNLRQAFVSVGFVWAIFTMFAAVPFWLLMQNGFSNAFFETMSALTTTGLTMFVNPMELPESLLFWRSFLSWIGGIGIIVMAIVGIFTSYSRASKYIEAEGRSQKVRPNLKNAIRQIWRLYAILTLAGAILLAIAGMGFFEAITYSMSAISTTGFDSVSGGIASFNSRWIEAIVMLIAIAGATSFFVHYSAISKKLFGAYAQDTQFKVLVLMAAMSTVLIFPSMYLDYGSAKTAVEFGLFHSIGAATNGAFALLLPDQIAQWNDFVKIVLIALMFIGGSAGSTSGGIKIERALISFKSLYWKLRRSVSDSTTIFAKKYDHRPIEESEIAEVNQFILLYLLIAIAGTAVLVSLGNSLSDSLFEAVSAQTNAGISTGITHPDMPMTAKITLIVLMWVGRLEIIPLFAGVGLLLSIRRRARAGGIA